jgi:signal transduction histidine kinase
MKLRLLTLSVVSGLLAIGTAWVTTAPLLTRALDVLRTVPQNEAIVARLKDAIPFALVLDVVIASTLIFLALALTVGRSLQQVDEVIEREAPVPGLSLSGPLPARLERLLKRLRASADEEREKGRAQVDAVRKTNDELLRLQSELVGSDRLATVGKLASGVAHEVGNPLAGLTGYLAILQDKLKDRPDLKDLVVHAEGEVQRIDGIVRALLELGRPSRGKAEIIDARPVVESCVKLLGASQGFREVAITLEGAPTHLVLAEAGPLSQVVVNLLLNAAQAMGQKGQVHVTLAQKDGKGVIEVKDDGPGIPPEVMPRLFELFFTTKAPGKGTGLGLAMSRHLLAQFGGEIAARNAETGGAIFTVSLPLPPQAPGA